MTSTPEIARLVNAEIRSAWPHEAHNFTPWLYDNLDRISEVVGIRLEPEGCEVAVETFSADILARDVLDDSLVLIENQLEGSDHTHLGQIMTYLAGLEAKTVIWIATGFRDAHLSAVMWLNEHTADAFSFFAVQVKVVRIADSPLAPLFEVVARPNNWERRLHAIAASREGSEIGQQRLAFWQAFAERVEGERERSGEANRYSNRYRALPDLDLRISMYIASGGSNGNFGIFYCPLRGGDGDAVSKQFDPHCAAMSEQLDAQFIHSNPHHFFVQWTDGDFKDEAQWDRMIDWLSEKADLYEDTARQFLGGSA